MLQGIGLLKQCFSMRVFDWQYKYLSWQLNQCIRQNKMSSKKIAGLMRKIYSFLYLAMLRQDEVIAYKMVDLLKLAYGESIFRKDEPIRLMNLCIASMNEKQFAITGYLLDVYKPLMKNLVSEKNKEILEQLIVVGNIAKKMDNPYIFIKVANCIFEGVKKIECRQPEYALAILEAIRSIGLIAIKSHDHALFKETTEVLGSLEFGDMSEVDKKFVLLLTSWIYQIVKNDDVELFLLFKKMCIRLLEQDVFIQIVLVDFVKECANFAGMIAANTRLKCGMLLSSLLLEMTQDRDIQIVQSAVHVTSNIAKMAIDLHGVKLGFHLLFPLLEKGRALLNGELKFINYSDELQKQHLFVLLKNFVLLLDLLTNRNKRKIIDLLVQINIIWLTYFKREKNRRSVNQYCQLVLKYLLDTRQNYRKHLCDASSALVENDLFTENEKKRLGLLK